MHRAVPGAIMCLSDLKRAYTENKDTERSFDPAEMGGGLLSSLDVAHPIGISITPHDSGPLAYPWTKWANQALKPHEASKHFQGFGGMNEVPSTH